MENAELLLLIRSVISLIEELYMKGVPHDQIVEAFDDVSIKKDLSKLASLLNR